MQKTNIEWADMTWNPVTGCRHNCPYCYARSIAHRFGGYDTDSDFRNILPVFGCYELNTALQKTGKDGKRRIAPFPFGFEPTLHRYRLDESSKIKKPKTIFVCSMADLFGEWVPDRLIQAVFDACAAAPQHRYLFLTKNPDRYVDLYYGGILPQEDNFWYGMTVTSEDDPCFLGVLPRLNTFLSVEPLLSYLNVGAVSFSDKWIIIGAETGNRKGKITPEKAWVDNIVDIASLTNAAVFMKDSLIPIVGEENMRRDFPWKE